MNHAIKTPKRKNMKPKTHHFFFAIVVIAGWLTPPLAVLIRFGVGRDFFINILLTICGYFPGHFHNFYCQTIRNNKNAARTPKWAVKYGLVKLSDKRKGKHQWAGRYDERLPESAQVEYNNAEGSTESVNGTWDGRGPEPPKKDGNLRKNTDRRTGFSPWANEIDEDEVEGGPRSRPGSIAETGRRADPFDNEEFYATTSQTGGNGNGSGSGFGNGGSGGSVKAKKSRGFKGLLHRDRYENQGGQELSSTSGSKKGDRFDKMNAARGSSSNGIGRQEDEYQDDFERELNRASTTKNTANSKSQSQNRFDDLDSEGPEEAWGSAQPQTQTKTGGGTVKKSDDDFLNHTF